MSSQMTRHSLISGWYELECAQTDNGQWASKSTNDMIEATLFSCALTNCHPVFHIPRCLLYVAGRNEGWGR